MLVLALFAFVHIAVQVGLYPHARAMRSNQHQSFAFVDTIVLVSQGNV